MQMMRTLGLFVIMATLVLGGCVTETTGGFNVKKSDKEALANYIQLATGYLEQKDLPNTKRHLANAAKIDPGNGEVQAIWALVYATEGDLKLADRSFQQALRQDPSNSKIHNNYAAFLFANRRYDDSRKELQKVVDDTAYVGRSQAFENLGLVLLQLNRPDEAEGAFLRSLQLNPNQLQSTLELCGIYLARNNLKQAQTSYQGFVTMQQVYNIPHNPRSLWLGIQLETALGNRDKARNYGKLLETNFASAPETRLYKQLETTLK